MRISQQQGVADELHFPRTADGWLAARSGSPPAAGEGAAA
jgi:hypothetical protein